MRGCSCRLQATATGWRRCTGFNLHWYARSVCRKFAKIDLACWLYDHGGLSWGRAADFAGMDKYAFWGELDKRGSTILDEEGILEEIRQIRMK
jgi:predicted HTH domain antitoxin